MGFVDELWRRWCHARAAHGGQREVLRAGQRRAAMGEKKRAGDGREVKLELDERRRAYRVGDWWGELDARGIAAAD